MQLLAYNMMVETNLKYFAGGTSIMAKDYHVHDVVHF